MCPFSHRLTPGSRIVGLADATPTKESCRARLNGRRELQTRWMVARVVPFSDGFLASRNRCNCNELKLPAARPRSWRPASFTQSSCKLRGTTRRPGTGGGGYSVHGPATDAYRERDECCSRDTPVPPILWTRRLNRFGRLPVQASSDSAAMVGLQAVGAPTEPDLGQQVVHVHQLAHGPAASVVERLALVGHEPLVARLAGQLA